MSTGSPSAELLGEVSSWTPAATEAHHVVRDDLWVQIMTDDDPYFWHRQEQTAVWRMPRGTRPAWVRSRDGLFVHVETGPLVFDVVLPVLMQRQALAVLVSHSGGATDPVLRRHGVPVLGLWL